MAYIPLGGNGFHSPIAGFELTGAQLSGDATGGVAQIKCRMDPRYTAIAAYVTIAIIQGTAADADVSLSLAGNPGFVPTQSDSGPVVKVAAAVDAGTIRKTWNPTPIILPGSLKADAHVSASFLNVDGDEYFMSALFYIFDIRARELTPMGPLLWSRGAT